MSTISTALRHFKEPTKEQLTQIFFSLPAGDEAGHSGGLDQEKMDINAVLSLGEAIEDSYVSYHIAFAGTFIMLLEGWKAAYNATISGVCFIG